MLLTSYPSIHVVVGRDTLLFYLRYRHELPILSITYARDRVARLLSCSVHTVSDVSIAHLDVDRSYEGHRYMKTCGFIPCMSLFAFDTSE